MQPFEPDEEQGSKELLEDYKRLQKEQQKLMREQKRLLAQRTALYEKQVSLTIRLMRIVEHQSVLFGGDET